MTFKSQSVNTDAMQQRASDYLTAFWWSLLTSQLLLPVSNDAVYCVIQLCYCSMVLQVVRCGQPLWNGKAQSCSLAEELKGHSDSVCIPADILLF